MRDALVAPTQDVTATQRQLGALELVAQVEIQSTRALAGSADATFTFGPRASRPSSGAQGDRYLADDIGARGAFVYYYTGTAWELLAGQASGTDAQRSAYTPDATDDGGTFRTTDTGKEWEVSGGVWVDRYVTLDLTTSLKINGTKVLGARKTGWTAPTGTASRAGFDTTTVTLTQLAEFCKALFDDLNSAAGHGVIGP